jgi:hypothetical protein
LKVIKDAFDEWYAGMEQKVVARWPRTSVVERNVDPCIGRCNDGNQAEFDGRIEYFPRVILNLYNNGKRPRLSQPRHEPRHRLLRP